MSTVQLSRTALTSSFQRAVDKFEKNLTPKQKLEFPTCTLESVRQDVITIQERRGNQKTMRNMARIQKFLEAMDQYGRVVDALLNSTPFLGYIWVGSSPSSQYARIWWTSLISIATGTH